MKYGISLDEDKQTQIVSRQSTNMYRIGDRLIPAISNVDIPIVLADQLTLLNMDIVSSDIFHIFYLLLSRKTMKNTGMTIDFKNGQTFVFGKPENQLSPIKIIRSSQ